MKNRLLKKIFPVALGLMVAGGNTSCIDDLNQSIVDPQTTTTLDLTALLAKVYSSLVLTGQTGGAGNADMSQFDEGNSSWYRRIFEANELCSDECIWTWQGDASIPELTNIAWNSSLGYNELTYYRLMYNVTLCNSYLDNTEDESGDYVRQTRAEVRFVRALNLFHFIDLYGRAPFKEHVNADLPVEKKRSEVFDYVESELLAISGEKQSSEQLLDFAGTDENYGRADKVAAYMLLARLYLNAEVYTGTPQWEKARDYAAKAIASDYKLCTEEKNGYTAYEQLFMGDNGENDNARQEIIFPIRCDGGNSRGYGGSVYTVASCTGGGTPDQGLPASMWTCNRSRQSLVDKFISNGSSLSKSTAYATPQLFAKIAARDDRAMFYVDADRTYSTEEKTTFTAGFSILKWNNTYCDTIGGKGPKDESFADTDIPYIRLAEAYLTRAEANFRLGESGKALDDLQVLRRRANAAELATIDERTILDEWCREFYFEGRRRSDLIRFGLFTSSEYIWDWKGGSYAGTGVESKYNLYPIPDNELNANANMHQNPGY